MEIWKTPDQRPIHKDLNESCCHTICCSFRRYFVRITTHSNRRAILLDRLTTQVVASSPHSKTWRTWSRVFPICETVFPVSPRELSRDPSPIVLAFRQGEKRRDFPDNFRFFASLSGPILASSDDHACVVIPHTPQGILLCQMLAGLRYRSTLERSCSDINRCRKPGRSPRPSFYDPPIFSNYGET